MTLRVSIRGLIVGLIRKFYLLIFSIIKRIYWKTLYGSKFKANGLRIIFEPGSTLVIQNGGKITLNAPLYVRSYTEFRAIGGDINIGSNVFFNRMCQVSCQHSIKIDNYCQFGERCSIYDNDHSRPSLEENLNSSGFLKAEVEIGENSWLGANTFLCRGVKLGERCVVGANSVVLGGNYKDNSTLVGQKSRLLV